MFYRKVKLIGKKSLTHDVCLFNLKLPDGLFCPIKFGNHIALRLINRTDQLFRYYTVVPQFFIDQTDQTNLDYEKSKKICLIIKIYQDGEFTSKLGKLRVNDQIEMSDAFSIDKEISTILMNKERKTIYLLAAGTGITPMLSVIFLNRLIVKKQSDAFSSNDEREIKLIFCNKTDKDIILRDKFEQLIKQNDLGFKFSLINILSRPQSNWNGLKGRLNNEMVKQLVKFDQKEFLFLCGPDEFNHSALK